MQKIEVLYHLFKLLDLLLLFLDQILQLRIFLPCLISAVFPLSLIVTHLLCLLHPIVALSPGIGILIKRKTLIDIDGEVLSKAIQWAGLGLAHSLWTGIEVKVDLSKQ